MKRAVDLVIALPALAVLGPLLLLLAAAVRLGSRGPALYAARRVGRAGDEFTMYKLRTMYADRGGAAITGRDDPRVTPLGRVLRRMHLDELPQLWNIVRGEMSLVGPRPEDPQFVSHYSPEQRAVLGVRPGLTGPAQLAHRDESRRLPAHDTDAVYELDVLPGKLAIDLEYVRHHSLAGDLRILWRTIGDALSR